MKHPELTTQELLEMIAGQSLAFRQLLALMAETADPRDLHDIAFELAGTSGGAALIIADRLGVGDDVKEKAASQAALINAFIRPHKAGGKA